MTDLSMSRNYVNVYGHIVTVRQSVYSAGKNHSLEPLRYSITLELVSGVETQFRPYL